MGGNFSYQLGELLQALVACAPTYGGDISSTCRKRLGGRVRQSAWRQKSAARLAVHTMVIKIIHLQLLHVQSKAVLNSAFQLSDSTKQLCVATALPGLS